MNAPSPNPIPSPLVPQGSIPPKTTSRSGRVFLIATMVFVLHVGGLSLVLLQGCQKDAKTAGTADTNAPALALPPVGDTNANQYYTSATNLPPAVTYTPTNVGAPSHLAMGTPPPTNLSAPIPQPGIMEPPTNVTPPPATETALTDYKVASRDTLDAIARKHHITLKALKDANPNVDPAKLKVGQTLKIPAVPLPTLAVAAPRTTTATGANSGAVVSSGSYKVKSGDTLTKIAKSNGITVAQLRAANNMKTTRIQVGQSLKIPARTTAAAPAQATPQ